MALAGRALHARAYAAYGYGGAPSLSVMSTSSVAVAPDVLPTAPVFMAPSMSTPTPVAPVLPPSAYESVMPPGIGVAAVYSSATLPSNYPNIESYSTPVAPIGTGIPNFVAPVNVADIESYSTPAAPIGTGIPSFVAPINVADIESYSTPAAPIGTGIPSFVAPVNVADIESYSTLVAPIGTVPHSYPSGVAPAAAYLSGAIPTGVFPTYGSSSSYPAAGPTGYYAAGVPSGYPAGPFVQTISVVPTPAAVEYEAATHTPIKPGLPASYPFKHYPDVDNSVSHASYPVKQSHNVGNSGSPAPPSVEEIVAHGFPAPPTPKPLGGSNAAAYHGPANLPKGQNDLKPSLPQSKTNRKSCLGTTANPTLPKYLPGPKPHGGQKPWAGEKGTGSGSSEKATGSGSNEKAGSGSSEKTGSGSSEKTTGSGSSSTSDFCSITMPDTGVTRHYEFDVEHMDIAPDGVERHSLIINKQFPGPLIEANWGDHIEVKVNNLLKEGTTIHWHGLFQKESQWMDGIPSIDVCPTAPNGTFTYRFRADRFGSSWYHTHYSAQYSGGAYGPMIIYGPKSAEYDIDIGPVMVSDWYHDSYFDLVKQTVDGSRPPISNNVLINGKNNYPCANTTAACTPNAGLAKFKFSSGKKHLLRLINPSAEAMIKFSIDDHELTVVANDFVPVQPYTTNVITLGVGQRTDVIVEGAKNVTMVWMRADTGPAGSASCSVNDGVSPYALADVYYDDADENGVPTSNSSVTSAQLLACRNDNLNATVPFCAEQPATTDILTQQLDITFGRNSSGHFNWDVNNVTFRGDYNSPILLQAKLGNLTFEKEWAVYNFGEAKTVRLVVYNHHPLTSHPMHLHGHDFAVLDQGFGTWNGTITNAANPIRRDVQILQKAESFDVPSYSVLQYNLDNPGVWPFHCHTAWHVSAGLYVSTLERPKDIANLAIPATIAQTCRDWSTWTGDNVVPQIDSGL